MQLRVLVDNNTVIDQYYCGEPAVSYYLESGNCRILFDTGYSDVFMKNAEKMGIDLAQLTHVVLSHGHNDHTGGFPFLAGSMDLSRTELIAHPDCFLPKYDGEEAIGAPCSTDELMNRMICHLSAKPYQIHEHLIYLGEIPREHDFETRHPIGRQLKNGSWEADFLMDDSALVYKQEDGIFIITGCSHSGICNIISYAKSVCHEERILGILGGFHLFEVDERLHQTIRYLESCQIRRLYPCHCVSLAVKAAMMAKLPVAEVGTGMTISQD